MTAENRGWEMFFGIVAVGVAAAVLAESASPSRRLVGVGAIAAIVILYAFWGRRLVGHDRVGEGLAFVAAMVLAFGVGTYAITSVSYLLFAISPAIFLVLPLRPAIPAVIVASLTPLLVALPQDPRAIAHLGPIFTVSAAISPIVQPCLRRSCTFTYVSWFIMESGSSNSCRAWSLDTLEEPPLTGGGWSMPARRTRHQPRISVSADRGSHQALTR